MLGGSPDYPNKNGRKQITHTVPISANNGTQFQLHWDHSRGSNQPIPLVHRKGTSILRSRYTFTCSFMRKKHRTQFLSNFCESWFSSQAAANHVSNWDSFFRIGVAVWATNLGPQQFFRFKNFDTEKWKEGIFETKSRCGCTSLSVYNAKNTGKKM